MQNDWENFAIKSFQAMKVVYEEKNNGKETTKYKKDIDKKFDYTGKNKSLKTTVRIGQGFFRKAVLSAYDYKCCISGLSIPSLLVASHIVPWRVDKENRLNPRNSLALSTLHDKKFDIGIMTINENMIIRVSQKRLNNNDDFFTTAFLNYAGKKINIPNKFQPNSDFLAYHREYIFEC